MTLMDKSITKTACLSCKLIYEWEEDLKLQYLHRKVREGAVTSIIFESQRENASCHQEQRHDTQKHISSLSGTGGK